VGRHEVIVVDTHAWIWWTADRHKLSAAALNALESADEMGIASITLWEIAMLVEKNRLTPDRDVLGWLQDAISKTNVVLLPITLDIAVRAAELHEVLRDPIDCLITATALANNALLVTKDDRIRKSGVVETIW
jgi:PIN domain nuclease of toxin-antitoxin system